MHKHSFTREERLRGRKVFTALFASGKSFHTPLFRVTWQCTSATKDGKECVQAAFVVPKRNFKKATDRNRIRRRMKEAYRIHKNELRNHAFHSGVTLLFVCLYTGKEESQYLEIESKIIVTLQRLAKETQIASGAGQSKES